MYSKKGIQGENFYDDESIEKFRYNPYRKDNREIAEWYYKNDKILPFPLHVIIETSSLCNLKCEFCNRQVMRRPQLNMDMETFKKVVDECAENGVYSLSLYCLGEPFLNPNIREMMVYAKGRGIPYVDISTNGMFDMTPVLGTGVNEIIISMDKEWEEFERLRKGAKYNIVLENLLRLKKKRGNNLYPIIRLQAIKFTNDTFDFETFAEKWLKLGIDVVYVKTLEIFSHSLSDNNLSEEMIKKRLKERVPCKQLYFVLTVNSNGDIAYCCHDPKGLSVLGNNDNKSLSSAWGQMLEMRRNHRKGRYTNLCLNCVDYNW